MRVGAATARPMDLQIQPDRRAVAARTVTSRDESEAQYADTERLLVAFETATGVATRGKIVVVASARPGEGKTMVVTALAHQLAATRGRRVIVIDASSNQDVGRRLNGAPEHELQVLITGFEMTSTSLPVSRSADDVIIAKSTAGHVRGHEVLFDPKTLSLLRQVCDYVLIECQSHAHSPIVVANAQHFDGMVIVVEAGRTRWPVVQHMREQFELAGGKVFGVVLNKRRYYIPNWIYKRL